jgi:hypothetical protein
MKLLERGPRRLGVRGITIVVALITLVGSVAYAASASGQGNPEADPVYGIVLPAGYRDWPV